MPSTSSPTTRPSRTRTRAGVSLLAVAATVLVPAAPAAAAPDGPVAATVTAPLVRFLPDWITTVEGAIVANSTVLVDYDPARLPTCRAQYAGGDAWSINVEYRVDGGTVQRQPVTQLDSNRKQAKVLASVPLAADAHEVELWFVSGDRAGCREYDSRYGANYRFPVAR
ncbi:hypothetical protein EV385_6184 [Krasilnikovia cinnamomea]|uniref:Uncharacterized protein n=1 Tax=Krasilnikovia cinnamomea TaxID=349313 RepID=A0A4V2G7X1_9ACTN|nr:DUF6209 family protein [Krasilnikovia cinnamomea]RZU54236.1 hypothetical protein EV385_6184 [Krasilnikovia cinnamomea]